MSRVMHHENGPTHVKSSAVVIMIMDQSHRMQLHSHMIADISRTQKLARLSFSPEGVTIWGQD